MSKRMSADEREARARLFSHQTEDHYEEIKLGERVYIKMYDGNRHVWLVAAYSLQSFANYKNSQRKYQESRKPRNLGLSIDA
jgi:hypothetical protein